jgi:DNA-binding NarL/FixJ family response regulator
MPADPLAVARRCAARMDTHRAALSRLADKRADAVRDALASGMSRTQIASELGITKQAVALILKRQ